jgi:hypothetical protein
MGVKIGDTFRDTYNDKTPKYGTQRTIRVIEILEDGVRAEVLTGYDGKPPEKPRTSKLMLKTLRAGYEQVSST